MVYVLHFQKNYKHARHYIGFCEHDLDRRLEEHRAGTGARLMQVVTEAGIEFDLARVWPEADRKFERRLKKQKNSARLCPLCNPNSDQRMK